MREGCNNKKQGACCIGGEAWFNLLLGNPRIRAEEMEKRALEDRARREEELRKLEEEKQLAYEEQQRQAEEERLRREQEERDKLAELQQQVCFLSRDHSSEPRESSEAFCGSWTPNIRAWRGRTPQKSSHCQNCPKSGGRWVCKRCRCFQSSLAAL